MNNGVSNGELTGLFLGLSYLSQWNRYDCIGFDIDGMCDCYIAETICMFGSGYEKKFAVL